MEGHGSVLYCLMVGGRNGMGSMKGKLMMSRGCWGAMQGAEGYRLISS